MKQRSPNKADAKSELVIGRQRFAKISAVEGIRLSGAMQARAQEFDRRGTAAEERRLVIIKNHRKA